MGNFALTALPMPRLIADVPPFFPLQSLQQSTGLLSQDGAAPTTARGDIRTARSRFAIESRGITENRSQKDVLWRYLDDDRTGSDVDEASDLRTWQSQAQLDVSPSNQDFSKPLFSTPSEPLGSFDYVFGGYGFKNIQLVCVSRLFVCQRALCVDLTFFFADQKNYWLDEQKQPSLDKSALRLTTSLTSRPANNATVPSWFSSSPSITTEAEGAKGSSPADGSPFRPPLKSLPDVHTLYEKGFDETLGGFFPASSEVFQTVQWRRAAYAPSAKPVEALVFVKGYRYATREPPRVLPDVARRLEGFRVALCWSLHPHVLPHYRTDCPPVRMPGIMRRWLDQTVRERLHVYPKMVDIEKRWLMCQMLCAVAQLHSVGVTHGSLSTTNFLCAGTDHVFLVDVGACYKPYFVNASESCFSLVTTFFETPEYNTVEPVGFHRPCYIAPERFLFSSACEDPALFRSDEAVQTELPDDPENTTSNFTPDFSMYCASDVFALGYCLAEVFLDGEPAITFPDALALASALHVYPSGAPLRVHFPSDDTLEHHRTAHNSENMMPWYIPKRLNSLLSNSTVLELITLMCSPDAQQRPSAMKCLEIGRRSGLFPEFFFSLMLPLTTLLLHPLLQASALSSLFLHSTLDRVFSSLSLPLERTAEEGKPTPETEPYSASVDCDPVSFYQSVANAVQELPFWASQGCRVDRVKPGDRGETRSTEQRRSSSESQPVGTRDASAVERNAASFKHLASTHAKVPPDVEQSKVSQFTVTHNNAALSSDAPGASRLDFTGLSLFDHFMCLWKHAHYTFANSAIQIAPRFNKGSEAPFPQLTLEKGLQFTANLCALWEAGYQQHISAKDVRVDVWNLLGGHQGVFTHPSASVLENLYAERNAVYSPLFSVEQSATGGSLDKTALPDKATLRETGLDATDYSLCVLSLFFAKLATTSNAEAVTLHLLNASALILLRCRFSPGTLFERIFPLLLKMMHSKPGVRVSRQALCLLTKLLVRCDPNAIPLGYIPDCVFPLLADIAQHTSPQYRSSLPVYLPSLLQVACETFSLVAECPVNVKALFRPTLLNFFRPLLARDAAQVRVALLRSSASFPRLLELRDLLDTVVPFLISFMNTADSCVRTAFCLHIFELLEHLQEQAAKDTSLNASELAWTIASALFPCFESALGDHDELVVEAALEGLLRFFSRARVAPQLLTPAATRGFAPVLCLEQHRWRQVARQIAKRCFPLLAHPNVALAAAAETLLKTLEEVCFPCDSLGAIVHLTRPLQGSPLFSLTKPLAEQLQQQRCVVSRCILYFLAELHNDPSAMNRLLDAFKTFRTLGRLEQRGILLLSYVIQAFKPSAFGALQCALFAKHNTRQSRIRQRNKTLFLKHYDNIGSAEKHRFFYRNPLCTAQLKSTYHNYTPFSKPQPAPSDFWDNPCIELLPLPILSVFGRSEIEFPVAPAITRTHNRMTVDHHTLYDCLLADPVLVPPVATSLLRNYALSHFHGSRFVNTPGQSFSFWVPRQWQAHALRLPLFGPGSTVSWASCNNLNNKHAVFGSTKKAEKRLVSSPTRVHAPSTPNSIATSIAAPGVTGSDLHNENVSLLTLSPQLLPAWPPATPALVRLAAAQIPAEHNETNKSSSPATLGSEQKAFSRARRKNSCWNPRGILLNTISVHQQQCGHINDKCSNTVSALGFELSSDGRRLISGSLHALSGVAPSRYAHRVEMNEKTSSGFFCVWDCDRLPYDAANACLNSVTLRPEVKPTCFSLLNRLSAVAVGTDLGGIATFRSDFSSKKDSVAEPDYTAGLSAASTELTRAVGSGFGKRVIALGSFETLFEYLVCSAHANGVVGCWDLRCPSISSCFSLPLWTGLPSSLCVVPSHHSIHVTTLGGYLATFDLRFALPAQVLRVTLNDNPVSLLTATPNATFDSAGICVTLASQRNELCVLDPMTGVLDWGFLTHMSSDASQFQTQKHYYGTHNVSTRKNALEIPPTHQSATVALPRFEIVNSAQMRTLRSYNRYQNLEPLLAQADFGGDGNILALWSPPRSPFSHSSSPTFGTPVKGELENNILLTGGTDRRVRHLSLSHSVQDTYIVTDDHKNSTAAYLLLPESSTGKGGGFCKNNKFLNSEQRSLCSSAYLVERRIMEEPYRLTRRSSISRQQLEPVTDANRKRHIAVGYHSSPDIDPQPFSPSAYYSSPASTAKSSWIHPPHEGHQDAITALSVIRWPTRPALTTWFPSDDEEDNQLQPTATDTSRASHPVDEPIIVTGGRDGRIKLWQ